MEFSKFAVDETPYCAWDWELRRQNLNFINSLDPRYFEYLANVHNQGLKIEEQKQYCSLSLRTAYSHGLETFFALLFASLQAPDCVIGWLHKYDITDIKNLLKKVRKNGPLLSKPKLKQVSWETISNMIHSAFILNDKEQETIIKKHFATAWQSFANDFIDEKFGLEYNSIKHGFRVTAGGFSASIALENKQGETPSPKKMNLLDGSEFGSSFFGTEKIGNNKLHLAIQHYSRNWALTNFVFGLYLISVSLKNIISYLKLFNHIDPKTVEFSWPNDKSLFEMPWTTRPHIIAMGIRNEITLKHIKAFSKDEILAVYKDK